MTRMAKSTYFQDALVLHHIQTPITALTDKWKFGQVKYLKAIKV